MPRLRTRPQFAASDSVQAIEPFAGTNDDGTPFVANPGTIYRGDDPLVQAHPQFFIAADTPNAERPNVAWDEVNRVVRAERAKQPKRPAPLTDDQLAVAAESFSIGSRSFAAGQRVPRSDEAVRQHPEMFHAVPQRLDAEDNAA